MKLFKGLALVVAILVVVFSMAGISFTAEKMAHKDFTDMCQAKIKALKDSAAVLQKTNPDLANGLSDLAAEKEKKLAEMSDMQAKNEARKKLLRDSAAALQKTNPDLAEKLWGMSDRGHMGKMGPGGEQCPKGTKMHSGEYRGAPEE